MYNLFIFMNKYDFFSYRKLPGLKVGSMVCTRSETYSRFIKIMDV